MRETFGISTTDECRLWYQDDDSYVALNDLEKTLLDPIKNDNPTYNKVINNLKVII